MRFAYRVLIDDLSLPFEYHQWKCIEYALRNTHAENNGGNCATELSLYCFGGIFIHMLRANKYIFSLGANAVFYCIFGLKRGGVDHQKTAQKVDTWILYNLLKLRWLPTNCIKMLVIAETELSISASQNNRCKTAMWNWFFHLYPQCKCNAIRKPASSEDAPYSVVAWRPPIRTWGFWQIPHCRDVVVMYA